MCMYMYMSHIYIYIYWLFIQKWETIKNQYLVLNVNIFKKEETNYDLMIKYDKQKSQCNFLWINIK